MKLSNRSVSALSRWHPTDIYAANASGPRGQFYRSLWHRQHLWVVKTTGHKTSTSLAILDDLDPGTETMTSMHLAAYTVIPAEDKTRSVILPGATINTPTLRVCHL